MSTRPDEFVAGQLQRLARAGRAHARAIEAIGVHVREHEKAEAVIAEDDGRLREIEAELHPRAATRWREHVARGIKLDDIARCAECRYFERCRRCHLSFGPCSCGELLEWRQGADARHAYGPQPVTTGERHPRVLSSGASLGGAADTTDTALRPLTRSSLRSEPVSGVRAASADSAAPVPLSSRTRSSRKNPTLARGRLASALISSDPHD